MIASLNPLVGLAHMFGHDYFRYAFLAGTAVAVASGLVGYFLVLRAQVFTVDALSHAAVTGALAALAFGFDRRIGLFVATIAFALLIGLAGPKGQADDAVIGSVFAWLLGLGVLFLSIYSRSGATGDSQGGTSVLFGSIFGLDAGRALLVVVVGGVVAIVLLGMARPLLFASLDPAVAAGRGVPVGALGLVFLVLVGITAGEATQAVGALLLLGLLAGPPAIAQRLAKRPYRGLALSVVVAVGAVWAGLGLSYAFNRLPPSFTIIAVIAVGYLLVAVVRRPERREGPARG